MSEATIENAKVEIGLLVAKYKREKEGGRLSNYKEENTKKDFITPLFRALGWDVENLHTSDEVTNEDQISKKRVDYAFRINGIPKFFLEAKALNKPLDEIKDAEQAINYAWHKSTTWAILTNFETVIIYNAEVKEKNVSSSQFIRLNYDQFVERVEDLWLLSKPAFIEGALDKKAEVYGKKHRKIKVGEQLLSDLREYRENLSKNILKNNPSKNLSQDDIDEAVQKIIDRLIFIRTTEDRKIEPTILEPMLREFADKKKGKITKMLKEIYFNYDRNYNSKLFTFDELDLSKRHLCEDLEIDDEVLQEVINGLYHSKDGIIHYDFSAIDADVLGNIYEQYLSHILRKTEKRAKVELKEAHRKEQGIYYTPTYIVDYIVKNTIGEIVKGKKPEEVKKLKILDPSCGSGGFLLKAFDYLDKWNEKNNTSEYVQAVIDANTKSGMLTPQGKILRDNIFGVDLDPKAVEIAQLNLLLKAAEKRNKLPSLNNNVKCGNSLIDDASVAGNRAFKWEDEFREIMLGGGGFDVIIGNPPYVSVKALPENEKQFFVKKYDTAAGQFDLYGLFIEKAIKMLREDGIFGFITSNTYLSNKDFGKLREYILKNTKILKIINLGETVFEDANLDVCIIILQKTKMNSSSTIEVVKDAQQFNERKYDTLKQDLFCQNQNFEFTINIGKEDMKIFSKLEKDSEKLGTIVEMTRGIEIGSSDELISDRKTADEKPVLVGKDIGRYQINFANRWVKYSKNDESNFKKPQVFEQKKILLQRIRNLSLKRRLVAALDDEKYYTLNTLRIIMKKDERYELEYIIGIINSNVMNYYFSKQFNNKDIYSYQLEKIPIRNGTNKTKNLIIENVGQILELNKKLISLGDKQTDERQRLEKEIQETDKKIDDLVYDLYGLTEEERKIVEGAVK